MAGKKKRKPTVPAPQLVEGIAKEIDALIERLSAGNDVPLSELLASALRTEEYMRVFRERTAVQATKHVPQAVEAVGRAAKNGDIQAARLLFDVVGLLGGGGGSKGTAVFTQVNIGPKLKDIIDITSEEEIVNG